MFLLFLRHVLYKSMCPLRQLQKGHACIMYNKLLLMEVYIFQNSSSNFYPKVLALGYEWSTTTHYKINIKHLHHIWLNYIEVRTYSMHCESQMPSFFCYGNCTQISFVMFNNSINHIPTNIDGIHENLMHHHGKKLYINLIDLKV